MSENRRLKPLYGMINGQAAHLPAGSFFLRYELNNRRVWQAVGKDATKTIQQVKQRDVQLRGIQAGLASLYVQANLITLEQARHFHAEWTPRGWAVAKDQLTTFEQALYLRQPGYGSSYVTGKILFDNPLTDYSHQQELDGKPFVLRDFMNQFNQEGIIPISLMIPEMVRPTMRDVP